MSLVDDVEIWVENDVEIQVVDDDVDIWNSKSDQPLLKVAIVPLAIQTVIILLETLTQQNKKLIHGNLSNIFSYF